MNMKQPSGKNLILKNLTTIEAENGWVIVGDSFGDWRGTNEALGLRTRLKRETRDRSGLDWVKHDISIGRLQTLIAGEWTDNIDRFDKARDYVQS